MTCDWGDAVYQAPPFRILHNFIRRHSFTLPFLVQLPRESIEPILARGTPAYRCCFKLMQPSNLRDEIKDLKLGLIEIM